MHSIIIIKNNYNCTRKSSLRYDDKNVNLDDKYLKYFTVATRTCECIHFY